MKDVYQESDHLVKRARQLIVKVCERTSNRKLCSKALAAYDMQLEAAKQSKKKTTFLEWAAIQQSAIATVVDLLRQKRRGFLGRIGIRSSEIRELEVIAKRLRKLRTTAPKKAGTSPKPASSQTGVPFFDEAYYLSQCPEAKLSGRTPYEHYKNVGWKLGMDPHPGFATKWYLAHSPDVAALGLEPLKHYLEEGWKDGRSPCPTFGKAGTGVSPPPCSRQMSEADSWISLTGCFSNRGATKGIYANERHWSPARFTCWWWVTKHRSRALRYAFSTSFVNFRRLAWPCAGPTSFPAVTSSKATLRRPPR